MLYEVITSLLGKQGLRQMAQQNLAKAAYARELLAKVPGLSLPFAAPVFNEFVVRSEKPVQDVLAGLETAAILGRITSYNVCYTKLLRLDNLYYLIGKKRCVRKGGVHGRGLAPSGQVCQPYFQITPPLQSSLPCV